MSKSTDSRREVRRDTASNGHPRDSKRTSRAKQETLRRREVRRAKGRSAR